MKKPTLRPAKCLSCFRNIPWFFFAFGRITCCGSASLKMCVCDAAYPWSQIPPPHPQCIRETKHLSTDADSINDTKKNPASNPTDTAKFAKKKPLFFARRFCTIYEQKFSNLRPFLFITFPQGFRKSKKFEHWTWGSGGKNTFNLSEQMREEKKCKINFFCRANFTPFMSNSFQIWDHFFPFLSPKDSENPKVCTLDFRKWGQKIVKMSDKHQYQKKSCLVRQNLPENIFFGL